MIPLNIDEEMWGVFCPAGHLIATESTREQVEVAVKKHVGNEPGYRVAVAGVHPKWRDRAERAEAALREIGGHLEKIAHAVPMVAAIERTVNGWQANTAKETK